MDFFERIKELVKEKTDLTLRSFIESMNMNYETYYSGKRRENLPRADETYRIAQALGTTVEYLVTGKEPPEKEKIRKYLTSALDELNKL